MILPVPSEGKHASTALLRRPIALISHLSPYYLYWLISIAFGFCALETVELCTIDNIEVIQQMTT